MYTVKVYQLTKTFSKYLGNQKCLQTCQMEMPGGNLARGCPLWVSLWKKWAKMAETQIGISQNSTKKRQFLQDFSSNFHTWTLYRSVRQCSSKLQSSAEALRATHKKLWAKKFQKLAKTPILGPKIVNLVNKKWFNRKTSAGTSSYIIIWWPHAKFEANRMVQLWDRDFCQTIFKRKLWAIRGPTGPYPSAQIYMGGTAPAHLALEAKVEIGPLSESIWNFFVFFSMIFLLENWNPTDKQHSTCRRTASTSPRFVPAECDDTRSVVYQSGSLWFAWATRHRPPDCRNGVKISILTFYFWKSSPFPLPCGRMGTASPWET